MCFKLIHRIFGGKCTARQIEIGVFPCIEPIGIAMHLYSQYIAPQQYLSALLIVDTVDALGMNEYLLFDYRVECLGTQGVVKV